MAGSVAYDDQGNPILDNNGKPVVQAGIDPTQGAVDPSGGSPAPTPQGTPIPAQPAAAIPPPTPPPAAPAPAAAPTGLAAVTPPDPAAYQVPGEAQIQANLTALQNTPPITPDLTQFQGQFDAQKAFLDQLSAIATGKAPTAAETQGALGFASAQAESQGDATAGSRYAPASQVLREQNVAQTVAQSQVLRQTAVLSAQQQTAAQAQAADLSGKMAGEALQQQQLVTQAQEANASFKQNVLGDEFNLATLHQNANIAYEQANQSAMQWQYQQHVQAQMNDQANTMRYISMGLQVAGIVAAVALAPETGGTSLIAGAALGANLAKGS